MLVLCTDCNQHYDDTTQKARCGGALRSVGMTPQGNPSSHQRIERGSPLEDHIAATRPLRGRARTARRGML